MSADTEAAQKLRAFLERIERLEEGRKSLADDIADVYKELIGEGFDKDAAKVVLKIRKTDDGLTLWTGKSETIDIYLSALGMLPEIELARAPARVRENIEQFPAHDAETGEVFEPTQEQLDDPARSEPADAAVTAGKVLREPVAAEQGQIIREGDAPRETDCQAGEPSQGGSVASCPDTEHHSPAPQASQALQADKTSEAVCSSPASLASPEGTKLTNVDCGSDPLHALQPTASGQAGAVTSLEANPAPATLSDDDVPAFLKKDKQPNPDCQKPGNCKWDHSQISCSTCQQAADQRRARAV